MRLKVTTPTPSAVVLDIEDEDLSIADIVRHELLKDERVTFAGFTEPHPLLRKTVIRMQTKGTKPMRVLNQGCSRAIEGASNILTAVRMALGREK